MKEKKSSKMAKLKKNSSKGSEYLFREPLFLLVPVHILEMIVVSIVTIILLW